MNMPRDACCVGYWKADRKAKGGEMKFQSVASVAVWAIAAYLAVSTEAVSAGAGMDSPREEGDFVAVEWSERDGERWTVNGLADREAGRLMATNTVFAICSNTKPLTSVLVLTFVEEGVLSLDDPVSKHFPEFAEIRLRGKRPNNPVTLRHLITHTTGIDAFSLCNPGVLPDMTPFRDQVRLAVAKGLRCEPGTEYRYSNAGFGIMGAILEKVTGRKVTDLMQERIFNPLGMTEATFYPDGKMLERAAVPYYFPPDGSAPMRYDFTNRLTSPLDNTARTPLLSSCVFCTAGDYLKFSQMIARKGLGPNGRRILSEKTFTDYLLTRQTPPGDKTDASFDIHFNAEHTEGSKGGLYATSASWNWADRSCKVVFRAKSPYAPKGVKSKLDATGFGGAKTVFGIDDQRVAAGKASCLVSNNGDRHGVATVKCLFDGVSIGTRTVELAIGEAKRVEFDCANRPQATVEFKVVK